MKIHILVDDVHRSYDRETLRTPIPHVPAPMLRPARSTGSGRRAARLLGRYCAIAPIVVAVACGVLQGDPSSETGAAYISATSPTKVVRHSAKDYRRMPRLSFSTVTVLCGQDDVAECAGSRLRTVRRTADGTLLVAFDGEKLREFAVDGHFIRDIGGLGSGPGEYRQIEHVATSPINGSIAVFDPVRFRVVTFGKDGMAGPAYSGLLNDSLVSTALRADTLLGLLVTAGAEPVNVFETPGGLSLLSFVP